MYQYVPVHKTRIIFTTLPKKIKKNLMRGQLDYIIMNINYWC
jgi:hypothetical protein